MKLSTTCSFGALLGAVSLTLGSSAHAQTTTTESAPTWEQLETYTFDEIADALRQGQASQGMSVQQIRAAGMLVFTTPFTKADGFGDGPFDPLETDTRAFGQRPTLQGNGTLLRLNGLDAQSCNECHVFISNRTTPPSLGIGGVGGMVNNAVIMPTMIDVADSSDDRTQFAGGHDPDLPLEFDGVADYNGRFANPPFLFGGGGVELLGKEMTRDLQALLVQAQNSPMGTITQLDTKGVNFGHIETVDNAGTVELHPEGIGPVEYESLPPEEVLVVRPFGRKGENFSMRDFDRGAMQFHFGIEPVEVVGENIDKDGDGIVNEITVEEMTMLHVFDVTNPRPVMGRRNQQANAGFALFQSVGCVQCHIPELQTESRSVPLAHPEVASDPDANVYAEIDLRRFGFRRAPGGGLRVPLFADLKRHKMGPGLAESFEGGELANDEFTTARLWGIADTAPYLHDGRATTLFEAIDLHGGEAQAQRDAFIALTGQEQEALIAFLGTLRTPKNPNVDLVGIVNGNEIVEEEEDELIATQPLSVTGF